MQQMEKIIEETKSTIVQAMSRKITKIEKLLATRENESDTISISIEFVSDQQCRVVEHSYQKNKKKYRKEEAKIEHTTSSSNMINTKNKGKKSR
jgi:hypothetical protein